MARRRSILAQIYEAHRRTSNERARQKQQFERDQERLRREVEAERLAEEKAALKQQQAAEREIVRAARAREREERAAVAAAQKAERERARAEAEARRAEARARTAALVRQVGEIESILVRRHTGLRDRAEVVAGAMASGGPDAGAAAIDREWAASEFPDGVAVTVRTRYHPESREIVVDCEMPGLDVVPRAQRYRYLPREGELRAEPRKESEVRRLYRELVARITLRVVAELVDLTPAPLVDSVVFNGFVSARNRATGRPVRQCVMSLMATRDLIDGLDLDFPDLDPGMCLDHLSAIVSPHPYDLVPVKPVVYFDPTRYKLIDEIGAVAGLDHRLDLLALSPQEFEYLIRQLFEAVGMKHWVRNTQASKDEGVDAVAVNEDPLVGGVCVIQAKRYKNVVGLEAVHALAGVMGDKAATRGILVTTSWFGKASVDFVQRHGRMQLIDGRNLKQMLAEALGLDVLIGLPKLPRGWHPEDLT